MCTIRCHHASALHVAISQAPVGAKLERWSPTFLVSQGISIRSCLCGVRIKNMQSCDKLQEWIEYRGGILLLPHLGSAWNKEQNVTPLIISTPLERRCHSAITVEYWEPGAQVRVRVGRLVKIRDSQGKWQRQDMGSEAAETINPWKILVKNILAIQGNMVPNSISIWSDLLRSMLIMYRTLALCRELEKPPEWGWLLWFRNTYDALWRRQLCFVLFQMSLAPCLLHHLSFTYLHPGYHLLLPPSWDNQYSFMGLLTLHSVTFHMSGQYSRQLWW